MTASFQLDRLLTVEALAARLRVSPRTVRSWVWKRIIPCTRLGRRLYFDSGVVESLLNGNAVGRTGAVPEAGIKRPQGKEVPKNGRTTDE